MAGRAIEPPHPDKAPVDVNFAIYEEALMVANVIGLPIEELVENAIVIHLNERVVLPEFRSMLSSYTAGQSAVIDKISDRIAKVKNQEEV